MKKVLIVDDEEAERETIKRYLRRRGATFDVAEDPVEAIEKLSAEEYEFVFLDLDLGGGVSDGEGVLAWMERHQKRIATALVSEAAALPFAIRLEKTYQQFVKIRMTHGDLENLGDVVDKVIVKPEKREDSLWGTLAGFLVSLVVVVGVLVFAAERVQGSVFFGLAVAAVLIVLVVGVLTLRQLRSVSESGFVKLVEAILRKLPGSWGKG